MDRNHFIWKKGWFPTNYLKDIKAFPPPPSIPPTVKSSQEEIKDLEKKMASLHLRCM